MPEPSSQKRDDTSGKPLAGIPRRGERIKQAAPPTRRLECATASVAHWVRQHAWL